MKRITLAILMTVEAVLAAAVAISPLKTVFMQLMWGAPFAWIAQGLRILSESGRWGNGIALALWALVSMIPLIAVAGGKKQKGTLPEKAALCLLSAALFAGLYAMINPGTVMKDSPILELGRSAGEDLSGYESYIVENDDQTDIESEGNEVDTYTEFEVKGSALDDHTTFEPGENATDVKIYGDIEGFIRKMVGSSFGALIWSLIVLYLLLVLVRRIRTSDKKQLFRSFRSLMAIGCLLIEFAVILKIADGASAFANANYIFRDKALVAVRLLLLMAIPFIFNAVVIFRGIRLFEIAGEDGQKEIERSGRSVIRAGIVSLLVTAILAVTVNIVTVALLPGMRNVKTDISIPVTELAVTMVMIIFARLLTENRDLREDNRLFI